MPSYRYICKKCRRKFSITMSISEHGKKRPRCPKCGSLAVSQMVEPFFVQTSKKS